jgi:competence protein ComGC
MTGIRKSKKAQEEIVGFVLVVVIVAVIFLVFLGITIRQKSPVTQRESGDVSQFIGSMMEYTTDCAITSDSAYISLGDAVRECYSGSVCRNSERSCDTLNRTLQGAIESNWKMGPDRPIKGYIFNSTYVSGNILRGILTIKKGNCTAERIGGEYLSPAYPGSVRSSLEMCY